MGEYSAQDLKYAAEFREGVHRDALAILRRTEPDIALNDLVDRCNLEDYFQEHWDYPGMWYTVVAIPPQFRSREALIDAIVRDTRDWLRGGRKAPERAEEQTRVSAKKKKRRSSAPPPSYCPDDSFYELIAEYPALALDYCLVNADPLGYRGCESHWWALGQACKKLLGREWSYDVNRARGTRTDSAAQFSSRYPETGLNYRKAFLYPPHENGYSGKDFVRVNAALFPKGTEALETFSWSTDWSDYFDDGHEWWGALCLTVYDRQMDRFAVILASETD